MRGRVIWVRGPLLLSFYIFDENKLNHDIDPKLWSDPDKFQPERWLEHPNNPLFTFGVGYRMCAGSLLAYRELYLTFIRMLSAFEIRADKYIETHPIKGVADLTTLVSMPKTYEVRFIPRNENQLREGLEEIDGERSQ